MSNPDTNKNWEQGPGASVGYLFFELLIKCHSLSRRKEERKTIDTVKPVLILPMDIL